MSQKKETRQILGSLLWEAQGGVVSGPSLCARAGITRQAVWKTMERLLEEGFPLEIIPRRGYRLCQEAPDTLHPLWLSLAASAVPGRPTFEVLDEVPSTQHVARELFRRGVPSPVVVLAESQSEGRGRRGRSWSSPRGCGIYMSVLLRPSLSPRQAPLLSLAAGLAVRRGIWRKTGIACDLKWPNDLLRGGGKVCGILTEAASDPDQIHFAVVGMGINVNLCGRVVPKDISPTPPALLQREGDPLIHRGWLVVAILEELVSLVSLLESGGSQGLVAEYESHCATLGRAVQVITDQGITLGTARGISSEGALVVESAEGVRQFASADVIHASLG
ncbi:MAG TPA: biotin--[acetyl-CoA-carboxylase] ligase [Synergistaceae bacterium]|nr:biotin--[acetyl-CoA-carboxylase] ligase [Synergistaceae bacterium]